MNSSSLIVFRHLECARLRGNLIASLGFIKYDLGVEMLYFHIIL